MYAATKAAWQIATDQLAELRESDRLLKLQSVPRVIRDGEYLAGRIVKPTSL